VDYWLIYLNIYKYEVEVESRVWNVLVLVGLPGNRALMPYMTLATYCSICLRH
jgi:hypothetical protein